MDSIFKTWDCVLLLFVAKKEETNEGKKRDVCERRLTQQERIARKEIQCWGSL